MGAGKRGGIFQTCTELRGPPELAMLPEGAHLAAPLIRHTVEHGVPITLLLGMDKEEKEVAIRYGTYASSNKKSKFINSDLDEQMQAGHVTVLPLETVNCLHNLWLSPVAVILQVGSRACLFLYFTWRGLNDLSKHLAPV